MSTAKIEKFTPKQINMINFHVNFLRPTVFLRENEYSRNFKLIVESYENLLAKMKAGNIEKESIAALINDISEKVTTLSAKYEAAPRTVKSEMAFLDQLKTIPAQLTELQNSIAQLNKEPSSPKPSFNLFAALGLKTIDIKKVIEKRKEQEKASSQTAPTVVPQPAMQKQQMSNLSSSETTELDSSTSEAETDDDQPMGLPERDGGRRLGN